MDLGISGKRAIVCASSKGLGRACAMSLAQNGVSVVINGRGEEALVGSWAQAVEDAVLPEFWRARSSPLFPVAVLC